MLAKSSERRCRQKLRRRMRDEIDPETALSYFQVSVNIIEARNLAWSKSQTISSYVVVTLGKEKYRTSIRKKIEEPCFKEYLLLEWHTNLKDLQKSNLYMSVMEPRCCAPPRLLGQASVDLGVVWAQPSHQIYHKWVQLSVPRDPAAGTVGFLKVDVSIMCRGDIQVMPVMVAPVIIEENALPASSEQQTANYHITVYNAFGIALKAPEQTERRQEKLPSTFVKVSFSGISVKTSVQPRTSNPCYSELISIAEVFPNNCQSVRLEVCSAASNMNQILASVDLRLEHISHNGDNGFVPTFGPSLLHMYGNSILNIETQEGPFYRGALLISLKTIVPYLQQGIKTANVEPISAIQTSKMWTWRDFCIFCPILEVSMLDQRLSGKCCGIAVTIGEIPIGNSDNEDFTSMKKEIKRRKLHYTGAIDLAKRTTPYRHLNFANAFPVLQQATRQPDFRFRIYRNNLVKRIAEQLNNSLQEVEHRLISYEYSNPSALLENLACALEVAADHIRKFFEAVYVFDPHSELDGYMNSNSTELDHKQLTLQKEELEKIYHQIKDKMKQSSSVNLMKLVGKTSKECYSVSKKNVKMLLAESNIFAQKLKTLVFKSTTEGWPDIVIWLLHEGSRFAYYKIRSPDVLFSKQSELSGKDCGRIQTLYMKPLKCSKHLNNVSSGCACIAGKVELLIWMGLYAELAYLDSCLPQDFQFKAKEYDMCLKALVMMVEIRVFIFKAKLMKIIESATTPSSYVRVNVMNSVKETKVEQKTLTPVWDQVLTISCMTQTSQERLTLSPPEIMVEVCSSDAMYNTELIGRSVIQPTVIDTISANFAPKLEWRDLFNELDDNIGNILVSATLRQVPETLVKSTIYNSANEFSETYTQDLNTEAENDIIEELPQSLKPKFSAYKVDVYWWGLRELGVTKKPCAVLEIDDLAIKSDAIAEKKPNCNFPNGRISQTFEGHLDTASSYPLTIKLCDSSTFGRMIFMGTNAVKNPTKYLKDWLPKYERDASLKAASFVSANFCKISKTLYVKKSNASCNTATECSKMTISSSLVDHKKWPTWKRLFCRREPQEDELVLLPVTVHFNENQLTENIEDCHDWWSRFFSSQKDRASDDVRTKEKIKIYNSELESQPEYHKFKDWCSTVKLYNGKKTGLPEKDEELRCGFLKAGIAIYSWPPPPDTVAVSLSGVELQRGFFDDFPSNSPCKFLVRVYIVRGLHLAPREFTTKCDPYVLIKCGSKVYGDRNHFLQNTVNPIFGRTYELRCSLPEDYLLSVSLHNHEDVSYDTLIGATDIDLEDRIYSRHRGRVGLSPGYNVTGAAKWRDIEKPSDILAKLCSENHLRPPEYPDGNTVIVNGVEYRDTDKSNKTYISASERKENICLNLLHKWQTLPLCGYHLVPEHVETRKLYNPDKPGDQGKVLMWVDIFPLETSIYMPVPVDITPRKVEEYELRVTVWHVQSLRQDNFAKKKGLDLYVKAWIGNEEQSHYTDIHYNCVNGEANFNWRMIFYFQYQHSDKKLIVMEKGPFTEFEERLPPILVVQVADTDAESVDDCLGILTLDLNAVPRGSKKINRNRDSCINNEDRTTKINLFSARALRSWWPLKSIDEHAGAIKFEGMIDLELHLLPKSKAIVMPVGLGRDAPFPLPEPDRRDAFANNIRASIFENIFKRGGVDYVIGAIFLITLLAFCFWKLPNITVAYFLG